MLFQETQHLRKPILYIFLIGCWAAGVLPMLIWYEGFWPPFTASVVFGPLILFLYLLRLRIEMDHDALTIRLWPFFRVRHIPFEEIKSISVHAISPLGDYGGWGYRLSFDNTTAYILQGKYGATLALKKGTKKIAISLKDPEGFRQALAKSAWGTTM